MKKLGFIVEMKDCKDAADLRRWVDLAQQQGIDGVELLFNSKCGVDFSLDKIKPAFENTPVEPAACGLWWLNTISPDPDERAAVRRTMLEFLDMAEAIGWVHTSEITYAARDSDFDGFAIKRGDYLALTEHQLFGTDRKLEKLLRRLAEAEAQQSAEFINIFYGEDVSEKEAQKALKLFTECCPNAEITLLSGGQPVYYYMISAE